MLNRETRETHEAWTNSSPSEIESTNSTLPWIADQLMELFKQLRAEVVTEVANGEINAPVSQLLH